MPPSGLYVPLDVNYQDDEKILSAGALAELVYVRSCTLAKRRQSDGLIHPAHLRRLTDGLTEYVSVDDLVSSLVSSGLWVIHEDGWIISAFLNHNPSRAETEAGKASEAERKAHWRQRNKRSSSDEGGGRDLASVEADACETDGPEQRDAMSHGTERDATRSESESEGESEHPSVVRKRRRVSGDDPLFSRFWMAYPRKAAKGDARKAWSGVVGRGVDPEQVIAAASRYATQVADREERHIRYPAGWLRGEMYADEAPQQQRLTAAPSLKHGAGDL